MDRVKLGNKNESWQNVDKNYLNHGNYIYEGKMYYLNHGKCCLHG